MKTAKSGKVLKGKSDEAAEVTTTIYLVRHAEQETTTTVIGDATTAYNLKWVHLLVPQINSICHQEMAR
jgi:hypothetical protein